MRRWVIRCLCVCGILVFLLIAGVQIFLLTDWPRAIVESRLCEETGLQISLKSLHAGWGSESVGEVVTVRMSQDEEAVLVVPRVVVLHTSLPAIILTRNASIHAVDCHKPEIKLTRDASGNWNVTPLIHHVNSNLSGASDREKRTDELPIVKIHDGIAAIARGEINFEGEINLNDWTSSQGEISFRDVTVDQWFPELSGESNIVGTLSGTMSIERSDDARSPEPMKLTFTAQSSHNDEEINLTLPMNAVGFVGPSRLILDQSSIQLGDGSVELWGRVTWHEESPFVHLHAKFVQITIDQLARLNDPEIEQTPGLINGKASIGGYVHKPHRLFGEAEVSVTEADLAHVGIISTLYNALNLKIGSPKPEGKGKAWLRLEGDALEVSRFEYFNRGTDIVAHGRIEDVLAGKQSPVNGFAAGAIRPLKKIDFPVFKEADKLMESLQTGTGAVRIEGTVGEYEVKAVPFSDIRSALRAVLTGK